jgi:CxxC motif-containing protein (DUF1111 family)
MYKSSGTQHLLLTTVSAIALLLPLATHKAHAQAAAGVSDPGVRGGPAGAGGALPGLNSDELNFFFQTRARFQEVDSVQGTIADVDPGLPTPETGGGLGPRFNGNACAVCHIQPAVGGSSPTTNPQIRLATLDGATNTIPSFISNTSPVREARFITNPNGTPDGGVHDLFVITGRTDAQGCNILQPNFPQAVAANNVIFRIPISVNGDGLVENTQDSALLADAQTAPDGPASLGITVGFFNTNGNDGTATKFGWKAQNKSLLLFSGEAYNVEQGVTNELFNNERDETQGCVFNPTPEDATALENTRNSNSPASDFSSDIVNFAGFMRLSAPPAPAASSNATVQGSNQFVNIGCAACHVTTHTTAASIFTNQSNVAFHPFSDFALHNMGTGLQDQVSQGAANGQQFRSAPLWGVGKRIFFLHDGRTSNLVTAIEAHSSSGSEANQVIANFNKLSASDQQDIILFLRSL